LFEFGFKDGEGFGIGYGLGRMTGAGVGRVCGHESDIKWRLKRHAEENAWILMGSKEIDGVDYHATAWFDSQPGPLDIEYAKKELAEQLSLDRILPFREKVYAYY
jgi:hypothetical protein